MNKTLVLVAGATIALAASLSTAIAGQNQLSSKERLTFPVKEVHSFSTLENLTALPISNARMAHIRGAAGTLLVNNSALTQITLSKDGITWHICGNSFLCIVGRSK